MTDQEFDRIERDMLLLLRDLKQDRVHQKRMNKKIKTLQKLRRRNEELSAQFHAHMKQIRANLSAEIDRMSTPIELTFTEIQSKD